ncbi:MAG: NusG domain II-containing protein [Ruminococcaceae bacterium]|nr:NusG domain II-containing protein [Oscillospiraceae bacterium]
MKKGDVITGILLIAITCCSFLFMLPQRADSELTLVIKVNSETYKEIKLTGNYNKLVEINSPFGYNKISIDGKKVKMVEAGCEDGLCIREAEISRPHESIVCLPNRLIVYLTGETELDYVSY